MNQADEIADLKVTIASLEETVSDYVALENEAIEIAKVFGSDKSGAFINGVIDSFVQNDKI